MKHNYPYIRAWGALMHSFTYYIESQVKQAQDEKAPHDAIYKDHMGRWHCWSQMKDNNQNKPVIKEWVDSYKETT
jgi:hypothetical protein